ncbi:hypothetical protein RND71_005650 [Anisodus tanguticus]|uniref:Large ribosomal subunit protein uL16m n=1 Tax=Anisodus tanguticus TaxID=243964 RepID=A0AAE1SSV2_9SOLA|nr:hypothetical protein RND71_005650 [Anisodus tanguticus]
MKGPFRRNGKIWVRVLVDIPITGTPTEVRMGKGKGNPTGWIARVSRGQILFEMDGTREDLARQNERSNRDIYRWEHEQMKEIQEGIPASLLTMLVGALSLGLETLPQALPSSFFWCDYFSINIR